MSNKIKINKASRDDIINKVRGFGEEMAEAIIRYREEHRGFKSIEEFQDVPGISNSRVQKLKDQAEN
jgi:competence protein ComEA